MFTVSVGVATNNEERNLRNCLDAALTYNALHHLLKPFEDEEMGTIVGHLMPVNSKRNVFGFTVNLVYYLYHAASTISPKMCELIASRDLDMARLESTITEEDWLAKDAISHGYAKTYTAIGLKYYNIWMIIESTHEH